MSIVNDPPWRWSDSSFWVRTTVALALLVGLVLRLCPQWFSIPDIIYDAREYRRTALDLLATGTYSNPFREPLLPYLLSVSYGTFGDHHLLQLRLLGGMSFLAMVGALLLMREILPQRHEWLAALVLVLLAIDGDQLAYARELATAPLHAMLLTACACALAVAARTRSRWPWLGAGVTIGLLGLSRSTWLVLVAPAAAFAMLRPERRLQNAALVLLSTAVVVTPWMVRNEVDYGFFRPAASAGVHLFSRTWHLMPEGSQGTTVRKLAVRHEPEFPDDHGAQLSEDVKWKVFHDLAEDGWTMPAIDREFMAVSLENLWARPFAYAKESVMMLVRSLGTYDFTWLSPRLETAMRAPLADQLAEHKWLGVLQKAVFRMLLPLVAGLALVRALVMGWRNGRTALLVVSAMVMILVLLLALGGPATGVRRYRSELDDLLLTTVAAGLVVRRPRPRPKTFAEALL